MIIIIVHEWGHFIASRLCGVYVEEFAVGMGPKILSRVSKKGTIYSWRVFPIGGFCRMRGEEEAVDEEGSFSRASVWQRMAIVAAGPFMNFVLAMLLVMIFTGMYGYVDTKIVEVEESNHVPGLIANIGCRISRKTHGNACKNRFQANVCHNRI